MSVPVWGSVRAWREWVRRRLTVGIMGHHTGVQSSRRGEWVAIVPESPPALVEMYGILLDQHGIPAVTRSMGVGRGAMGGVPMFVALLVPAECAAAARELLHGDYCAVPEHADDETDSERTVDRGER